MPNILTKPNTAPATHKSKSASSNSLSSSDNQVKDTFGKKVASKKTATIISNKSKEDKKEAARRSLAIAYLKATRVAHGTNNLDYSSDDTCGPKWNKSILENATITAAIEKDFQKISCVRDELDVKDFAIFKELFLKMLQKDTNDDQFIRICI